MSLYYKLSGVYCMYLNLYIVTFGLSKNEKSHDGFVALMNL